MVKALFDFSFSRFVTKSFISVIYGLSLVAAAILALGAFVMIRQDNLAVALLAIPLVFLLAAFASRVWAEVIIVAFRIAENTGDAARRLNTMSRSQDPLSTPPVAAID